MNLSQFLKNTGVRKNFLAVRANVCPATITRILQGSDCSLSVAVDLHLASEGRISLLDLNKEIKESRRRSVKHDVVDQGNNNSDKHANA